MLSEALDFLAYIHTDHFCGIIPYYFYKHESETFCYENQLQVVDASRFGSQQDEHEVAESIDAAGSIENRPETNPGKSIIFFYFQLITILSIDTGPSKNNNFQIAQKLSPPLMEVLDTDQRYLNVNEIRKLVRAYKNKMKLKECDSLTIFAIMGSFILGGESVHISG